MINKPMLFTTDDLAEGVYAAASGSPEVAEVTCTLEHVNAWSGGHQYSVSFTNNSSKKLASVTVKLKLNGNVTKISGGGDHLTGIVNGTTATITFDNYGNGFKPGETVNGVHMQLDGTGDISATI